MGKRLLLISLVVSIAVHLVSMVVVWLQKPYVADARPKNVEIEFIDTKKASGANDPVDDINAKQMVEQDKTVNDEVAKDAKYLSQFNQKVAKETRAELSGKYQNSGGTGSAGGLVKEKRITKYLVEKQKSKDDKQVKVKTLPSGLPMLSSLTPDYQWRKKADIDESNQEAAKNAGANGNGADASRSNDHLKDTERSLQTMLNTREFVYYSYYARIKNQLNQYWEPKIKEKVSDMFRKGRRVASDRDHITKLLIVLNTDGILVGVKVLGPSGEEELDDAAVEAFRLAAPFPNPPVGIVEKDGTIKIRWDFVLEV